MLKPINGAIKYAPFATTLPTVGKSTLITNFSGSKLNTMFFGVAGAPVFAVDFDSCNSGSNIGSSKVSEVPYAFALYISAVVDIPELFFVSGKSKIA